MSARVTLAAPPFWIALFGMLVASQLGHVLEHAAQLTQIHVLGIRAPDARGILAMFDTELVHFLWNSWILAAVAALVVAFPGNRWLQLSAILSCWHAFEHAFIYAGYLVSGISGTPGLVAAGGVIGGGLPLVRPDLHFVYNLAEVVPLALGFHAVLRPGVPPARATRTGQALGAAALAVVAVVLATGGSALIRTQPTATLSVPTGYATIQAAIDAAPAGALVRVGSGSFSGPLVIEKPLSLVGAPDGTTRIGGDITMAIITVRNTHDVTIAHLVVEGGEYGIVVDESTAVRILGSWVRSADFAGIRITRSAALIQGNEVRAGFGPYGMGIELANTVSRPPSLIQNNAVSGSTKEGIVLHNAHAMIERNLIRENGFRGVAINEMSMARVVGNTITDNADAGIAVVDYSMAETDGNDIRRVRLGPEGTASGIRSVYYAEVLLGRDRIDVPNATVAVTGGTFESRATTR